LNPNDGLSFPRVRSSGIKQEDDMTETHKARILEMRRLGCTYRHIAATLGLSEGTVKSRCLRAAKKDPDSHPGSHSEISCRQCGGPVAQMPKRKRRIFCSKACRQSWWNSHLYLVDRSSKALHHLTCGACGKRFSSYGNANRKYCSHRCYINDRYRREAPDGR
jgi:endogenous inhibitor of DNA gyrase (YacG/DUF329 family)/DNA-binding CsgD family transcriptional regulator